MFQAHYREGVALQCLGKEADALAAYAAGLAQDPKSSQLLQTFTEAAAQSGLKGEVTPSHCPWATHVTYMTYEKIIIEI